jgi:hypothetical protein
LANPRRGVCPGCKRIWTNEGADEKLCTRCTETLAKPVTCAECGGECKKATVVDIYPDQHHLPNFVHLANRVFWRCDCGAYVGSHEGSGIALGTAAGPNLRALRSQVHTYFDKLWKHFVQKEGWQKHTARSSMYGWLAGRIGIMPDKCHIAMFDADTCRLAIEACRAYHFPDVPLTPQEGA